MRVKKAVAAGLIGLTALGATAIVPNIAEAQEAPATQEDRRANHEARRAEQIAVLTDALGVGEEVLRAAHEAGQSIADIANAQGVPVEDVVTAIVDAKTAHIQERVEAGDLTQEEANDRIAGLAERVTKRVNATPGERGDGHGPRGHRGPRGEAPVPAGA